MEILDGEGNFERKADMFSKRTIRPNAPVTHADDPQAALAASLFHYRELRICDLKRYLAGEGVQVRL